MNLVSISSMNTMQPRSQSCHGVTFESAGAAAGPRFWLPWNGGGSLKVHPFGQDIKRSLSRPSTHFCDMAQEDDEIDFHMSIENDVEKPKATERNRVSVILLDQGLFTVYKCLFFVCFALNVVAIVLALTGHFAYAQARPALFCICNILALTLCRSEALLRVVFWLAVEFLGRSYVPLTVKTAATSFLQSIGGIHSGCGVSSVAWLVYATIRSLNDRTVIVAVSSAMLSLLCFSCFAAFPLVRHLHHNAFELVHRFAGWMALALLWVFVVLRVDPLAKREELWMTVAITFFTVLPWTTVRLVPVSVSTSSGHASIIKFAGGVRPGILGRISRSPLFEWHAFGIVSDGNDSHMMIAGAVGDFTRGLVSNPPTRLWVRGVRFAGLPYLVNMYRRAVLVATGSGICVFLSFLLQKRSADVCVVWVTRGVEDNFGSEIKEMVSGHTEGKVIVHDTAVHGRPNVAEMAVEAAKKWKAEVVVVTSNPQGSKDVVEACKAAGIPAFGPLWDS